MKITVEAGSCNVAIQVKGETVEHMKEAEGIVTRLLAVAPQSTTPPKPPIGFAGSTSAETEVSTDDDDH